MYNGELYMIKKLNKVLIINFILSFLPLVSSILTNLCILIVCMMGENITNIDGYSTMGIIIMGCIIYLPFWLIAVLLYIVLWIITLIYNIISLGCSASNNKSLVLSTNLTVNIFSYIMIAWLLLYSIFEIVSFFVLLFLCYNVIVFLVWCFVGALYVGSLIGFIYFSIIQTTYIAEIKQKHMSSVVRKEKVPGLH